MKKLILKLLFSVSFLFFISCETENLNDNTNVNQESKSFCMETKTRSLSIWYYPLPGHAMKCEVWEERIGWYSIAKFKSRTTHYTWQNGTFKTKNTDAVFAKIIGFNNVQIITGDSDSNNNNNWYVASTDWITPASNSVNGVCYQAESTHKIKVNGVWYERIINLNDHW